MWCYCPVFARGLKRFVDNNTAPVTRGQTLSATEVTNAIRTATISLERFDEPELQEHIGTIW